MAQESRELEKLQTRVSELETIMLALKIVAVILGVSGLAIGAGVFRAGQKAASAYETALIAKEEAGKAEEGANRAIIIAAEASEKALEDISTATESAKASLATYIATAILTPEVSWEQGQAPAHLGVRQGEGICFLTRVIGAFEGGGEWVATSEASGEYVLVGASTQSAVGASARCLVFPRR